MIGSSEYTSLPGENLCETTFTENSSNNKPSIAIEEHPVTLKDYLKSIVFMPYSLRIVCLTNLFCWMAHVSYSLYFTDFVGEAVFGGDPKVKKIDNFFFI